MSKSSSQFSPAADSPLNARIVSATPLHYAERDIEDYAAQDLPPNVRGGSSLRRWNDALVIVQDDISALAFVDPNPPHESRALLLPRGHEGRRRFGDSLGNKPHKLDLEASIVLPDGRYVAFGSGSSRLRPREVMVVVEPDESYRMIDAKNFYAAMRANTDFSGEDLNLEGTLVVDDALWLFQRGNSVKSDNAIGTMSLDAFLRYLDTQEVPEFLDTRSFPLGEIDEVPWGVTDAAKTPDGQLFAIGAAEDTDNPYDDGVVLGSIFIRFDGRDVRESTYETCPILDLDGAPTRRKIEGLDYHSGASDDGTLRFWAVTDEDDEEAVSELLVIEVA